MTAAPGRIRAFGIELDAKFAVPGDWKQHAGGEAYIELVEASAEEVRAAWSGPLEEGWSAYPDGAPFEAIHGSSGDVLFKVADRAVIHFDPDARRLSVTNAHDVWVQRALLDSVLFTLSLRAGYEALHAGAVHTGRGVLAIVSGTGGGKSTLTAELLHRGATLVTDDVLALTRADDAVLAWPGPPLMTIPSAVPHGPGPLVHELDGERWLAVPVHDSPATLAAVVILDRVPGTRPARLDALRSPFDILPHLIPYPQTSARAASRFQLAADAYATCGLWRLTMSQDDPPSVAADALSELDLTP